MKKLINRTFTLIVILCLFCVPVSIFAAGNINIYLNGKLLTFTTAQPINESDRIFAPIREIAEQLGFSVEFDEASGTATFQKDDLKVTHVIKTNFISIYKNNAFTGSKSYDVSSLVRNDRTLMPVRMMAETIEAELNYSKSGDSEIVTISVPEVQPEVNTITFTPTTVVSGENVTVSINANNQTTRIRLEGSFNTLMGEVTNYITNSDGTRQFNYIWTPVTLTTGFLPINAIPGNASGYNDSGLKFAQMPVSEPPKPVISSISTKKGTIYLNETVKFTVTTNNDATNVRISNDYDNKYVEASNYTISGDSRIFELDVKIEKTGAREFTIEVANKDGFVSASTKTHKVDIISGSTINRLAIVDIELSPSEVRPGNTAKVTVVTSSYATKVQIYDEEDYSIASLSRPTSTDTYEGTKTWEFSIRLTSTGTYRYYAFAYEGNDSVDQRFTLYCSNNASSSSGTSSSIKNITASPKNVSIRGNTEITVETGFDVDYLELYDYNLNYITYLNSPYSSSSSRNEKTWIFEKVYIETSQFTKFTVRAYDYSGKYVTDSVTVNTGSSSSSDASQGRITDITTDRDVYYDGYTVTLTVKTTNDIDYVRMTHDQTGEIRNMTYESGTNTYSWRTTFNVYWDNGSEQVLRIRAEDNNGKYYYDEIIIEVR